MARDWFDPSRPTQLDLCTSMHYSTRYDTTCGGLSWSPHITTRQTILLLHVLVIHTMFQEMVSESVRMERVHGWRAGLIPFAKDVDDTFLVSRDVGGWLETRVMIAFHVTRAE